MKTFIKCEVMLQPYKDDSKSFIKYINRHHITAITPLGELYEISLNMGTPFCIKANDEIKALLEEERENFID